MFAVILAGSQSDPRAVVGDIACPSSATGTLIVDVMAAGITRMEPHWLTGWRKADGSPQSRPMALGHEFAGVVSLASPSSAPFGAGQRVLGQVDAYRSGAMADAVSVDQNRVLALPDELAFDEASTLPLAGLTAWQAIVRYGELKEGQSVLIHGGNGGVGTFAVQIARHLGAHVVATVDAQYAALCRELGADETIDYKRERFDERGEKYDLVFDQIGGETQERSWGVLKKGGRLITIAGEEEDAPSQQRAASLGVTAKFFVVDWNPDDLRELLALVSSGAVRPIVGHRFTRATVLDAFAKNGPAFPGKAVLDLETVSNADAR